MKNTNTIFAAHDFSPASKNALNVAAELALKTDSELFIFNIIGSAILTENASFVNYTPTKEINKHTGLLKRSTASLLKKYPGLKVRFEIDYGFLVPTLIAKTEKIKPWLFVLGVKKRTNFEKVIFGDTSSALIDKVIFPTLVVPINFKTIKTNLVAYAWDGKTAEISQLNPLSKLLSKGDKLMAINITHHDEQSIKNAPSLKSALNKKFQDVEINLIQKMGLDEKNAFQKQLSDLNPDLLVVFAHHYSFWQSLFHKSFAKQAISFSKSPVLVVYN